MRRVVVTGVGLVSALGKNTRQTWDALVEGGSGVDAITHCDPADFSCRFAAEVKNLDPLQYLDPKLARKMDRFILLAIVSSDEAVRNSGLEIGPSNENRVGVYIGSGIGGPARYIANKTGANIVALELQSDQNKIALDLTQRCGLSKKVEHVCGDFLTYNWQGKKFDAVVSWLTLYHIFERSILLEKCFDCLKYNGSFYAEDLFSRKPFNDEELYTISKEIYGNYLPNLETYKFEIKKAGLNLIDYQDMSDDWAKFTKD